MTPDDWQAIALTARLASITTVLLLCFSLPVAWWLARTKNHLRIFAESVVALPLVLPPTVLGFYLLVALGPSGWIGKAMEWLGWGSLVFTFWGLVVGSFIYSLPFVLQPLQSSFEMVSEQELEFATMLGFGPVERFFRLVLPVCKRGIITSAVLGFAHTIGEFGVVLMLGGNLPGQTKVVSIAIFDHVESLDYGNAHFLSGVLLIFSFVTLLILYSFRRHPKFVSSGSV